MSNGELAQAVKRALAGVVNPRTGQDVIAGGQVRGVSVDDSGEASFVFSLGRGDPGALVREARAAAPGGGWREDGQGEGRAASERLRSGRGWHGSPGLRRRCRPRWRGDPAASFGASSRVGASPHAKTRHPAPG